MNGGWFVPAAVLAFVLAGCGGTGGSVTVPPSAPAPPVEPPLSTLGYAIDAGSRGTPLTITEYPAASLQASQSFQEPVALTIRFDPNGTLWADRVGEFDALHRDGTVAALAMYNVGALLTFDARGTLYTAQVRSVDVYGIRADGTPVFERSFATPQFACSAAADGTGTVYVAPCATGPNFTTTWYGISQYDASGHVVAANATATGPVAVGATGAVYAGYGGAIGVWSAGRFGAQAPDGVLRFPAGNVLRDVAVDRAGAVYAVVGPADPQGARTLLYFAPGSTTPATLQTGSIGAVATVP